MISEESIVADKTIVPIETQSIVQTGSIPNGAQVPASIQQTNVNVYQIDPDREEQLKVAEKIKFAIVAKMMDYRRANHWITGGLIATYFLIMMWALNQVEGVWMAKLREVGEFAFMFFIVMLPGAVLLFFIVWWRTSNRVSNKYLKKIVEKVGKQVKKDKQLSKQIKDNVGGQVKDILNTLGPGGF